MSFSREDVTGRDNYINELFAPEDRHLKNIRERLRADGKEGINVGPYEGQILHWLMRLQSVQTVVEVGTLYGYSALWMARALPKNGKLYCLELDENNANCARELLMETEIRDRVEVIAGDALSSLKALSSQGPFDMAFIDANKSGYLNYLDWAEANVKKGGLIVGDNTFLFGNVIQPQKDSPIPMNEKVIKVMNDFNKRLADRSKYNSVLLPTAEGMTIAQKLF